MKERTSRWEGCALLEPIQAGGFGIESRGEVRRLFVSDGGVEEFDDADLRHRLSSRECLYGAPHFCAAIPWKAITELCAAQGAASRCTAQW